MPPNQPMLGRGKGTAINAAGNTGVDQRKIGPKEKIGPKDSDIDITPGPGFRQKLGGWFSARKDNFSNAYSKTMKSAGNAFSKTTKAAQSAFSRMNERMANWRADRAATSEDRRESRRMGAARIGQSVKRGLFIGVAAVAGVSALVSKGLGWLQRKRSSSSNYTAFIFMGLVLFFVQVRMYNWGTAPITGYNQAWYYLNLFAMLICGWLTPVEYGTLAIITFVEAFALPWGMPYLNQVLVAALHAEPSKVVHMGITVATMPAVWPIWLIYGLKHSNGKLAKWLLTCYIIFMGGLAIWSLGEYTYNIVEMPNSPGMSYDPIVIIEGLGEMWKGLTQGIVNFWTGTRYWVLNEATGGLYEAQVEKSQKEPLGVTLEQLVVASPSFYSDEQPIVWGTVRGRTITGSIPVNLSCWSGEGDKRVDGKMKYNRFEIYLDEIKDFDCRFDPGQLRVGQNMVTVAAEYPFETMSYLKAYFMDETRLRSMRKEEVDSYISVQDKDPKAIYTNGPVEVALATTMPLMAITKNPDDMVPPKLSMMVKSRWDGKLKSIDNLRLSLPDTIDMTQCYPDFATSSITEEGRKVYDITKKIDKNLEQPRIFKCDLNIANFDGLFNNAPLSMVYFRLTANYHYIITASIVVNVMETPPEMKPHPEHTTSTTIIEGGSPEDELADGGNPPLRGEEPV